MKRRIIITEEDLTSNVELLSSYDVVYVPGFRRISSGQDAHESYYHNPTLFTDQYKFRAAMGANPATFSEDYAYAGNFKDTAYKNPDDKVFKKDGTDPGYRIANYLLSIGIPVYYEVMNEDGDEVKPSDMYKGLVERFVTGAASDAESLTAHMFESPGDYSIKFITTGGYPVFEHICTDLNTGVQLAEGSETTDNSDGTNAIMLGMLDVAAARGDAIALIDHTDYPDRPLTGDGSVIEELRTKYDGDVAAAGGYGAIFTPWFESSNGKLVDVNESRVPASVGYLSALAVQVRDYNPWLAVSGTTRGRVPGLVKLHTGKHILSNNVADSYQAIPGETVNEVQISINPITYIRNVGYCIWGNRTLRNNNNGTKASSFLNIRSATADVKKAIYDASQSMLFEQNTEITWINFKSKIEPLLERMVSNYILEDYSIVRYLINPATGEEVPAYQVLGVIKIRPYNSIEVFELSVQLENTSALVSEM